jgi:hypothetical protein
VTGNSLTLADGAVYDYDLGGNTASPLNDLLALTGGSGSVTLNDSYTLNVTDLSGGALDPAGKSFDLISYLGADPVSVGTWTINLPAGWGGTPVVQVDTSRKVVYVSGLTSVPEPATFGLISIGAVGLLLRRSRRSVA